MKPIKCLNTAVKKGIKSDYLKIFIINFVIAILSFAMLIIRGNGIFTLCNDFNEQQIPFHLSLIHICRYRTVLLLCRPGAGAFDCYH